MFSFTVSDSSVISWSEDGWEDKAGHTSKPGLVSPDHCVPPLLWSCPAGDLCGRRLKILHSIVLHTATCQDTPPGLNTDKDILGNRTRNRIGQKIDSCSVIAALYSGRDGFICPWFPRPGRKGGSKAGTARNWLQCSSNPVQSWPTTFSALNVYCVQDWGNRAETKEKEAEMTEQESRREKLAVRLGDGEH